MRRPMLLVSTLVFLGCSKTPGSEAAVTQAGSPASNAADAAAVGAMQDREIALVSSGNADSAVSVYAADVIMMPPGEPVVNGSTALKKWFEGMFKDYTFGGKYTHQNVQVSGDVGVVQYTAELTLSPKKGGKPMTEIIKGVHIVKRQADGSWKIAQDVWNTDSPPPPAK